MKIKRCIVCDGWMPPLRQAHPRALTCSEYCSAERRREKNRENVRNFYARKREANAG